jgi:hypothetical protein
VGNREKRAHHPAIEVPGELQHRGALAQHDRARHRHVRRVHIGMGDKLDRYKSELPKPGGFVSLFLRR